VRNRTDDPSALLASPKLQRLPKDLSEAQVEDYCRRRDLPLELRDKAMLELLYATGLRVSELVGLTMSDISLRQGVVRVIGKGNKERLVPLGEEAVYWLETYLEHGRPWLLNGVSIDVLFPSQRAQQMTRQTFWHRIKHYATLAGIDSEKLSPHVLRHALPRICSTTAQIYAWCRCCWDTAISQRRKFTPMSRRSACGNYINSTTRVSADRKDRL
jgi:integrase/recombinase XerD